MGYDDDDLDDDFDDDIDGDESGEDDEHVDTLQAIHDACAAHAGVRCNSENC